MRPSAWSADNSRWRRNLAPVITGLTAHPVRASGWGSSGGPLGCPTGVNVRGDLGGEADAYSGRKR